MRPKEPEKVFDRPKAWKKSWLNHLRGVVVGGWVVWTPPPLWCRVVKRSPAKGAHLLTRILVGPPSAGLGSSPDPWDVPPPSWPSWSTSATTRGLQEECVEGAAHCFAAGLRGFGVVGDT